MLDNRLVETIQDLKLDIEIVQMQISAMQSVFHSSMQISTDFDIIQEVSRLKADHNDVGEKSERLELYRHRQNTNATHGLSSNDRNNNVATLHNTVTGTHSNHSNLSYETNTSFFKQLHAYKAKHRNHLQAEAVIDVCNFNSNGKNINTLTPEAQSSTIKGHEKHFKQPDQLHTPFSKQIQAYKAKHHFLMNKCNASSYNQINEKDKTITPSFNDQMNEYICERKKSFREQNSDNDSSKKIPKANFFLNLKRTNRRNQWPKSDTHKRNMKLHEKQQKATGQGINHPPVCN